MSLQQVDLPWQGRSPLARSCSREGAVSAQPRAESQAARLYALYERGCVTDQDAATLLGLPLASVNARRWALMKKGLVKAHGRADAVHRTLWGLM